MSNSAISLLFIAALVVAAYHFSPGTPKHRRGDYQKKRFLTRPETVALGHLEKLLPHCRIHAQVSMGALIEVKHGTPSNQRRAIRNRFSQKIVDFVIEERCTQKILALVELDDYSHSSAKDRLRDQMTAYSGYKTIRLTNCKYPTVAAAIAPLCPTPPQNGNLPRPRGS